MDMSSSRTRDFEFHGNAREWFGIWIVNLLLSIVTLGIYSAWAKVRARKYFYQNTYVADRNFDYHATGLQILIGRWFSTHPSSGSRIEAIEEFLEKR